MQDSPLDWISVNSSKPGRNQSHTELVVQTGNQWAEEQVDADQDKIRELLSEELRSVVSLDLKGAAYVSLHRWRYAFLEKDHDEDDQEPPFFDPALQLASVGDWCTRSNVEHAWLSAERLAEGILAALREAK